MLKSLYVKNYALIDELTVEFFRGLCIITGETGAGKSIIIDALGLILGERASTEVVRAGTEKAIVEGKFDISGNKKVKTVLEADGLEYSDVLVVRREISARGQNRCLVNDSVTTLALIKKVGELVVDLHGQHEHQSLLRVETHGDMLDEFAGLDGDVEAMQDAYRNLRAGTDELRSLKAKEEQLREKLELYQYQIREIDALAPLTGEEESIEAELKILENAERLFSTTTSLFELLYDSEHSVHDQLAIARKHLEELAQIDRKFEEPASECTSAEAIIGELAKFVQSYNAKVEFNPVRLEELRQRQIKLNSLKKKYGGSLDGVIAHRQRIGRDAALVENFEETIKKLTDSIEQQRKECGKRAQQLSAQRHGAAKKVERSIVGELAKLGIRNAKFRTQISLIESAGNGAVPGDGPFVMAEKRKVRLMPNGFDAVEFFISTNLGEDVKPLVKVASGGEVSRIMLALKSILAKSDRLPVLIFDEIDVGVSGRIAQAVGMSLKELSEYHQIIAITHLPQIAGLADTHFVVFKSEEAKRATTSIRKLSLAERVSEVAKLMSGAEVTAAGLKSARELMGVK